MPDQTYPIDARLDGLRSELDDLRSDLGAWHDETMATLNRILATTEALRTKRRPIAFRWPWEPRP